MGGDFGPSVTVPAALQALNSNSQLTLLLVGNPDAITPLLAKADFEQRSRLQIIPAQSVIASDARPSQAIRASRGSSMRVALILNKSEFLTEKEISYFRRFLKEISKDYIKEENTEMLAKEELQQFLELYAKENERVAEEYIGDGQPLFSNEVKDLPKWNPQNEKMQEEIIQFFAAVTMDLRRTNEIQRQKINQQEKRIRQLEKRANEFVMFRDKAKHPFRTIWKKLFR